MVRPFDFRRSVLDQARLRQWGLCAHCGESMDDVVEHGHHVIPNQIGRPGVAADAFLRTAVNCVILCEDCHSEAHAYGNFIHGPVAQPNWYPFTHGKNGRAQNLLWRRQLESEWKRIEFGLRLRGAR
jgi:5-methylcytosine-specific restriction endonuclease McrA